MDKPHHIYTSSQSTTRAFAQVLAENLTPPVQLHDLSALPAPDLQRPTKQQLRTDLALVQQKLTQCQKLIQLAEPHLRLANELLVLRQEEAQHEQQIKQIMRQLGPKPQRIYTVDIAECTAKVYLKTIGRRAPLHSLADVFAYLSLYTQTWKQAPAPSEQEIEQQFEAQLADNQQPAGIRECRFTLYPYADYTHQGLRVEHVVSILEITAVLVQKGGQLDG